MSKQKILEKLQMQQATLLQKRQAAASRLQHFNSVKGRLEADESIIRSVELSISPAVSKGEIHEMLASASSPKVLNYVETSCDDFLQPNTRRIF